MYDVPSKEHSDKLVITAEMVKNRNSAELIKLPTKDDVDKEISA
jgi:ATP-dependent protease Clp ATPase subunit